MHLRLLHSAQNDLYIQLSAKVSIPLVTKYRKQLNDRSSIFMIITHVQEQAVCKYVSEISDPNQFLFFPLRTEYVHCCTGMFS